MKIPIHSAACIATRNINAKTAVKLRTKLKIFASLKKSVKMKFDTAIIFGKIIDIGIRHYRLQGTSQQEEVSWICPMVKTGFAPIAEKFPSDTLVAEFSNCSFKI